MIEKDHFCYAISIDFYNINPLCNYLFRQTLGYYLADAKSDVYEQQKAYGYLERDDPINLQAHQIAFNFQNIPNSVLIPENNVTTNFPQQQLPIADPPTAAC